MIQQSSQKKIDEATAVMVADIAKGVSEWETKFNLRGRIASLIAEIVETEMAAKEKLKP